MHFSFVGGSRLVLSFSLLYPFVSRVRTVFVLSFTPSRYSSSHRVSRMLYPFAHICFSHCESFSRPHSIRVYPPPPTLPPSSLGWRGSCCTDCTDSARSTWPHIEFPCAQTHTYEISHVWIYIHASHTPLPTANETRRVVSVCSSSVARWANDCQTPRGIGDPVMTAPIKNIFIFFFFL